MGKETSEGSGRPATVKRTRGASIGPARELQLLTVAVAVIDGAKALDPPMTPNDWIFVSKKIRNAGK